MTKRKPGVLFDDDLIAEGMRLQAEFDRRMLARYPQLSERPPVKKSKGVKARVSEMDAVIARGDFRWMTTKKPKGQGKSREDALAALAAKYHVSVATMENVILQRRTYAPEKMKK